MAQIINYTLLAYHPAYCTHRTKDITEFSPKLRLMTPPWQLWSATGNVDADKVRIAEAVHIWIAHPCKRPVPSIMSTFKMGMVLKRKELSLYLKASQPTAYFNSISPKKVFGGPFVFWEHVLWPWLSLHPDFSTWSSWNIWFLWLHSKYTFLPTQPWHHEVPCSHTWPILKPQRILIPPKSRSSGNCRPSWA